MKRGVRGCHLACQASILCWEPAEAHLCWKHLARLRLSAQGRWGLLSESFVEVPDIWVVSGHFFEEIAPTTRSSRSKREEEED